MTSRPGPYAGQGLRRIVDGEAAAGRNRPAAAVDRPTGYGLRVLAAWEAVARALARPLKPRHAWKIPGRGLHHLAARVCSPKTLERIVEPAIADLQTEYAQARTSSAGRARALITGYTAILQVIAMCAL